MKVEEYAAFFVFDILPSAKTTVCDMVQHHGLRAIWNNFVWRCSNQDVRAINSCVKIVAEKYDNTYHDSELEQSLKRIREQISTVLKAACGLHSLQ